MLRTVFDALSPIATRLTPGSQYIDYFTTGPANLFGGMTIKKGKAMRINLHWTGPHSYNDILDMDEARDYGLYQIYNTHPVYGNYTLVYIGQAKDETFKGRFGQPDYIWMNDDYAPWENNGCRIRVHTGRIHVQNNENQPSDKMWENWIDLAEHLLIFAHLPAWNSQRVSARARPKGRVGRINYRDVHVLNWGQYGLLMPEVSGARHTREERSVFCRLNDDPLESF